MKTVTEIINSLESIIFTPEAEEAKYNQVRAFAQSISPREVILEDIPIRNELSKLVINGWFAATDTKVKMMNVLQYHTAGCIFLKPCASYIENHLGTIMKFIISKSSEKIGYYDNYIMKLIIEDQNMGRIYKKRVLKSILSNKKFELTSEIFLKSTINNIYDFLGIRKKDKILHKLKTGLKHGNLKVLKRNLLNVL